MAKVFDDSNLAVPRVVSSSLTWSKSMSSTIDINHSALWESIVADFKAEISAVGNV